jgi:hypothetical protein
MQNMITKAIATALAQSRNKNGNGNRNAPNMLAPPKQALGIPANLTDTR